VCCPPSNSIRVLVQHPCPDQVVYHRLHECQYCNHPLQNTPPGGYKIRQVFDIPALKIEVKEHRSEQKICPNCHKRSMAPFPNGVQQTAQYGNTLKGLAVYLNQYHYLPYDRLQTFFSDIFGHKISLGMLVKINQQCYENLREVDGEIKRQLQQSSYLHHDETGIRVNKKLYWCHVASTPWLTSYGIHPKRGKIGIEAMGIIQSYRGRLIHDFFRPYFSYECQHALCNAHHLRELKFIEEEYGQIWAKHMAELLLAIKAQVKKHRESQLVLSAQRIAVYERCYNEIIMMGIWHPDNIPKPTSRKNQRGCAKQSKAKNLLDRLRFYRSEVLAFMYDHTLPFTNNQAEQDIRMLKVKQKVSGGLCSQEGAQWFTRIKGYLSTARKQGKNMLEVLEGAFAGQAFMPQLSHMQE
jgi:transposase